MFEQIFLVILTYLHNFEAHQIIRTNAFFKKRGHTNSKREILFCFTSLLLFLGESRKLAIPWMTLCYKGCVKDSFGYICSMFITKLIKEM